MKHIFLIIGLLISTHMFSQDIKKYVKCDITETITYTKNSEDGILLEKGQFNASGKHTGTWKKYDFNGNLLVIAKFKNGVKHGTWKHWLDGKYVEVVYLEGRRVFSRIVIEKNYIVSSN